MYFLQLIHIAGITLQFQSYIKKILLLDDNYFLLVWLFQNNVHVCYKQYIFSVSFCTLVTNGGFSRYSCLLIFLRMVLVAANVYYYLAIDSKLYHLQRSLGLLKHDERGSPAGSPNGDTAERPVTEKKDK